MYCDEIPFRNVILESLIFDVKKLIVGEEKWGLDISPLNFIPGGVKMYLSHDVFNVNDFIFYQLNIIHEKSDKCHYVKC